MIESILIANRGEIARRIIRTCREMGIRTIAVYSDADREQPFVQEADLALRLGPAPPAQSYLALEKLITLAVGNGVDAIHPGYGFLAENPALSAACAENEIAFIGPPAEVIRSMGDKAEAKRKMEAGGVPVVPGYVGEDQDEGVLLAGARSIGFPVLLKAVAGGGGRGIRLVTEAGAFSAELESARREAEGAFGDGRMMIEKYLEAPRHVEFQILADTQGNTLHLFERECSIQRRHQKIIEETPSPALDEGLRSRMGEAAVRAAHAIFYVGAGTVEFLVDNKGKFYFLEMNTRIQVEHPITELTLGLDMVRLQIEIAEGRPLTLKQSELTPRGHAIECRLNAEDPARGFLPSTGTLRDFDFPQGEGMRADAGFAPGGTIGAHYDSLLAKLIVWGGNRDEALRRMGAMLSGSRVSGIASNLPFLQAVLQHPDFRSGDYSTAFIERHGEELTGFDPPPHQWRETLLAAAAIDAWREYRAAPPPAQVEPSHGGPASGRSERETPVWNQPPARLNRRYTLAGKTTEVGIAVLPGADGGLDITATWEDVPHFAHYRPSLRSMDHGRSASPSFGESGVLELGAVLLPIGWDAEGGRRWLTLRGRHVYFQSEDPALASGRTPAGEEAAGRLRAPLPGKVLKVEVGEGDQVAPEQVLLVLEAMKMEHKITAPFAGRVKRILFGEGELVNRDDQLIEMEGE